MSGTVNVKLRPVKFAFLVNPNDSKSLARALELNASLWGSTYNPIIPTFEKVPPVWRKKGDVSGHTSKTILKGYIEAFNPDFLVPLGKCKKINLKGFTQQVVDDKDLQIDLKDATPNYGIGIFEVLQGFFDEEFKFKRRYPMEVIFPKLPRKNRNFYQSIFGVPSRDIMAVLEKHWKEPFEAKSVTITSGNYLEHIQSLFPRRLMGFQIKARNNSGWQKGECIFLMNAANNHDIIDYWNLRAIGWSVLPIPIQNMHSDAAKTAAQDFIDDTSGVSRHNEQIYHYANILKARSVDEKDVKDFVDSLTIVRDEKARGSRFLLQHWYPRIWDEWARDKDGVGYCDIESKTESHDFTDPSEEVSVKTVTPKFAFRFSGHNSDTRFANDIETSNYSHDDLYAHVIPEGGKNLDRELSAVGIGEWRFSKRSATYLSKHKNWTIHIKIPKAEDVFTAWMKDQGLEIKLSVPGRIARQMIRHLKSVYGINALANQDMIALLRKMESEKEMDQPEFWGEMSKIASTKTFKRDTAETLKNYMEQKIFQLGVKLQCPICTHYSWYDIGGLDYTVKCKNCLESFDAPTHSPDDIKWSYKTIGPFSLPNGASGVYPTLLTLRIFASLFHHNPLTPMLSFETKIGEKKIEVDLGLFFRESQFRKEDGTRLIFAECKTGGKPTQAEKSAGVSSEFDKKDIERMKLLAEKFPGAVLVFATLKEELSRKEIALLKPLVNKCRRYYKAEEPYNPVMILTKTELFAQWSFPEAWKEKGGKHAPFGNQHLYNNELLAICDATQQLYLGMKPWSEFIDEQFEKRRNRKRAQVKGVSDTVSNP